jgi:N utilization substance protein B
MYSIKKGYDLYYYLLLLIVAIKRYAESRIELALNKKLPTYDDLHPNTRFVNNKVILQIEESIAFKKYISERVISWVDHPELIKNLYTKLVESSYYKEYMECPDSNFEDDKQVLIDFYATELEDDDMFYDILEEQCIYWNDDVEYMVSMVARTIRETRREKFELLLTTLSEEKQEFAFSLFKKTIENYEEYYKLIDLNIENWDIDRVAQVDILIMQMGINELVICSSIPVSVTFDEYLELSKYYSTPKSSIFINGILDKVYIDMSEKGKIVKIGRGLYEE